MMRRQIFETAKQSGRPISEFQAYRTSWQIWRRADAARPLPIARGE